MVATSPGSWRRLLVALTSVVATVAPSGALAASSKPYCRDAFPNATDWQDCRVQVGGLILTSATDYVNSYTATFQTYLTTVLNASNGLEFETFPISLNDAYNLVDAHQIDFLFIAPHAAACLAQQSDIIFLVSILRITLGSVLTSFAGSIISKAGSNFTRVEDIRGARIGASYGGAAGMLMQQYSLQQVGVNVMTEASQIFIAGGMTQTFNDVLSGFVDVGFIRSDVVDSNVASGRIKWTDVNLINEIKNDGFPLRHCTVDAPEWTVAAHKLTPPTVSRLIASALTLINASSPDPLYNVPAKTGKYDRFMPPLSHNAHLRMLQSIGYYNADTHRCAKASNVLELVTCPAGYVKQTASKVLCPTCQTGYVCLCQPCSPLRDPDVVLLAVPLNVTWLPNVNASAAVASAYFQPSCARMATCATVVTGQAMTWRLVDQIGDAGRAQINAARLLSVDLLWGSSTEWQPMEQRSITWQGLETQEYVTNVTATAPGLAVVQVRINGQQAIMSPVVASVLPAPPQRVFCPEGQWVDRFGVCFMCPPGTLGEVTVSELTGLLTPTCRACPPGTYQNASGQPRCDSCPSGMFAYGTGGTACATCPAGTSTLGKDTADACTPCEAGQYSPQNSSATCTLCPRASYSQTHGQAACQPCPPGMATADIGSNMAALCGCAVGSYLAPGGDPDAGPCLACPTGMTCLLGSRMDYLEDWTPESVLPIPSADPGYFTLADAPASVYKCYRAKSCPGGIPEACSGGHVGLVCALCPVGFSPTDLGCAKCPSNTGSGVLAAMMIPLLFIIVVSYYTCNSYLTVNVSATLACGMILGQLTTVMQVLSIFQTLAVPWPQEVSDFLKSVSLSLGSTDTVKCILGQRAIANYGFRCLLPLVLVTAVAFLHCSAKVAACVSKRQTWAWMLPKTLNTTGQLLQTVFIALAAIVVVPLQCYSHPNGERSMAYAPQVLCGKEEHHPLVAFGVVTAIIFVLPFGAICVWANYRVVRLRLNIADRWYITAFRFLLFRFRPDSWWWGNVLNMKQLAIAFSSSLPSDQPSSQLIYICFVTTVYTALQCYVWPWKATEFNILEAVSNVLMITMAAIGSVFVQTADVSMYSWLLLICVVVLGILFFYYTIRFFVFLVRTKCLGLKASCFEINSSADARKLAVLWLKMCSTCTALGEDKCCQILRGMSAFDHHTLMKSVSAWQATAVSQFWHPPVLLRLEGLPHTDTDVSFHSFSELMQKHAVAPDEKGTAAAVDDSEQAREEEGEWAGGATALSGGAAGEWTKEMVEI